MWPGFGIPGLQSLVLCLSSTTTASRTCRSVAGACVTAMLTAVISPIPKILSDWSADASTTRVETSVRSAVLATFRNPGDQPRWMPTMPANVCTNTPIQYSIGWCHGIVVSIVWHIEPGSISQPIYCYVAARRLYYTTDIG